MDSPARISGSSSGYGWRGGTYGGHSGRTFMMVISGEIVDDSELDSILQGPHAPSSLLLKAGNNIKKGISLVFCSSKILTSKHARQSETAAEWMTGICYWR